MYSELKLFVPKNMSTYCSPWLVSYYIMSTLILSVLQKHLVRGKQLLTSLQEIVNKVVEKTAAMADVQSISQDVALWRWYWSENYAINITVLY